MARQQERFVYGALLLVLGTLWLLRASGMLGWWRLTGYAGTAVLLACAGLFYAGFAKDRARRYGLLLPAGFFASIGVLALAASAHVHLRMLTPIVFFAGPVAACAAIHRLDPRRTWALVCAGGGALLAVTSTLSIAGGWYDELAGTVFLLGAGAIFIWHFLRTGRDWAIIPGGILLTTSVVPLLERVRMAEEFLPAFVCAGFATTFAAVFLFGRPGRSSWARYPALVFAAIALVAGFVGLTRSVLVYLLPLLLIAAGVHLIRNALRSEGENGSGGPGASGPTIATNGA